MSEESEEKVYTTIIRAEHFLDWRLYRQSLREALVDHASDEAAKALFQDDYDAEENWIAHTAWTGEVEAVVHDGKMAFQVVISEGESLL